MGWLRWAALSTDTPLSARFRLRRTLRPAMQPHTHNTIAVFDEGHAQGLRGCPPKRDPVPGVIKQPSCFCSCNDRQPLGANSTAAPRRLHQAAPGSISRRPRRRRLLNGWPLAPGTDSSFMAVSLLPFVLVLDSPGRYYLGAATRTSRTAPSPGPRLYQLTFRGPLLAHNLMQCFSRHVRASLCPCAVSLSRLSILVHRPMLSKARLCPPPRYAVRASRAWRTTPAQALKLRRADGVVMLYFPLVPWTHLMHCYLVRPALQDSGPLARYPAATK